MSKTSRWNQIKEFLANEHKQLILFVRGLIDDTADREIHSKVDERWHRWLGVESKESCLDHFSPEDLKYYKDFWREEGEKAFEEYVKNVKNVKNVKK